MNWYEIIKSDIKSAISFYLKKSIIVNPNINERIWTTNVLSSPNSDAISRFEPYSKTYNHYINNRCFACCLDDGSFFQYYFEFAFFRKRNVLVKKANLDFYPYPIDEIDDLDEMKTYIRVDYSSNPDDYTPFSHPKGHIHFGLYNDFRIGINRVPLFSEFLNLALYLNYTEKWKSLYLGADALINHYNDYASNKTINIITDTCTLSQDEDNYINFRI